MVRDVCAAAMAFVSSVMAFVSSAIAFVSSAMAFVSSAIASTRQCDRDSTHGDTCDTHLGIGQLLGRLDHAHGPAALLDRVHHAAHIASPIVEQVHDAAVSIVLWWRGGGHVGDARVAHG